MDKNYNTYTYKEAELRKLCEAYFEACLSPDEEATLMEGAHLLAEGKLNVTDRRLASDLLTLNAIASFSTTALRSLEKDLPPGFEQRLEGHIDFLAGKRRRIIQRRLSLAAVAACTTLLITTGIGFILNRNTNSLSADSILTQTETNFISMSTPSLSEIPSQTVTSHGNISDIGHAPSAVDQMPDNLSPTPTPRVNTKRPVVSGSNRQKAVKDQEKNSTAYPQIFAESDIPFVAAIISIPEKLLTYQPSSQPVITTTAEVSQIVATPLSVISNTIETLSESLDFVNGTLFDACKSASNLSEEMLQASYAPLRSI